MTLHLVDEYISDLKDKNILSDSFPADRADPVTDITYNSKQIHEGTLFICKGEHFKEDYLHEAIASGAIAYVSDTRYALSDNEKATAIIVNDIRKAMAAVSSLYANRPCDKLRLLGITGTKGKTTTGCYVTAIMEDYADNTGKKRPGYMSSIFCYSGKEVEETHITTPEPVELQKFLLECIDNGIENVNLEVSSQGIKYERVGYVHFNTAVFTNIGDDHISPYEHPDFEDYFESKLRLFDMSDNAVINKGSDHFDRISRRASRCKKVVTYGFTDDADIYATDIVRDRDGSDFTVHEFGETYKARVNMPGIMNVENALAAIAVSSIYEIPREYILSGLARGKASGRMEKYVSKDGRMVFLVDFAHNKLSVQNLLDMVIEDYPDYDIRMIIGLAGNRAFLRRRDVGTLAGKYSKKVYIVCDNPTYETFEKIGGETAKWVEAQGCDYEMFEIREDGVKQALKDAMASGNKTIVLVTGKGGETTQRYGDKQIICKSDIQSSIECIEYYDAHCND